MNRTRLCTLLAVFFFVQTGAVFAQMKGWELGGWVGASNYFGDLNTNYRLNRVHLAGGIHTRYNFNERLAFRLGGSYGKISATDADSKNIYEQRRNLSFRSHLVDVSMLLEFNFLPYMHGHRDYFFTPYVFAGPAIFFYNPQAELDGTWYSLPEQGTEGQFRGEEYSTTQGALAYGLGFKMDFSYRWSLGVELSARKVFTDYLDDVSGVYADWRDIQSLRGDIAAALSDRSAEPKIGEPGRQRGNGKSNDIYMFLGVSLQYYFGEIRCPSYNR
ncbi:MAG: outer membrane beta-barrel protein [Lewinellaceae bacterium]|nr:outer membrane beta-barrel protein [Saprospiraceae bacterium]MCB9332649.1 outer membrane beta-barrel protein [Lewinellaceae bacterium]